MPSKDPIQRFADILENIILIEEFTRGMDLNAYQEDLKTRNATERCMERISEAAKKLGEVGGATLSQCFVAQRARPGKLFAARIRSESTRGAYG